MDMDIRTVTEDLIRYLGTIGYIEPEDLPNIDLYMDQVTTFMDEELEACKRHESDKILTKTMINNYAKNDLLPPPNKKKYSKEHVLMLIFIYYLKNILSINDIQSVLNPINDKYFGKEDGFNVEDIYREIFRISEEDSKKVTKDLVKKYQVAMDTFADFPQEDRELLHSFSFICMLSHDVYIKKMLIERSIDHLNEILQKEKEKADN